jgi:hypothetical protein
MDIPWLEHDCVFIIRQVLILVVLKRVFFFCKIALCVLVREEWRVTLWSM